MSVKIKRATVDCPQNPRSHPRTPLGVPTQSESLPTISFSNSFRPFMDPDLPGVHLWLPRPSCSVFELEHALRDQQTTRRAGSDRAPPSGRKWLIQECEPWALGVGGPYGTCVASVDHDQ